MLSTLSLNHENVIAGLDDAVGHIFWVFGTLFVVHFELPFGWLQPFDRIPLQDNSETSVGVRIELLYRIKAFFETAKQHLLDFADFSHRIAIAFNILTLCWRVGALFHRGGTTAHLYLIPGRLFI